MPDVPVEETASPALGASILRTVTPFVVAWIVAYLAKNGFQLTDDQVNGILIPVIGGIYYSAVRALEQKWPAVGWLLGSPKQPVYPVKQPPKEGDEIVVVPDIIPNDNDPEGNDPNGEDLN